MRKITSQSVSAFLDGRTMSAGNMSVYQEPRGAAMYLHGNLIALRIGDGPDFDVYLFDAGWQSATTKDRLNGILDTLNAPRIFQRDFAWYLGASDCDWTGCARVRVRDNRVTDIARTSAESGHADACDARRFA